MNTFTSTTGLEQPSELVFIICSALISSTCSLWDCYTCQYYMYNFIKLTLWITDWCSDVWPMWCFTGSFWIEVLELPVISWRFQYLQSDLWTMSGYCSRRICRYCCCHTEFDPSCYRCHCVVCVSLVGGLPGYVVVKQADMHRVGWLFAWGQVMWNFRLGFF